MASSPSSIENQIDSFLEQFKRSASRAMEESHRSAYSNACGSSSISRSRSGNLDLELLEADRFSPTSAATVATVAAAAVSLAVAAAAEDSSSNRNKRHRKRGRERKIERDVRVIRRGGKMILRRKSVHSCNCPCHQHCSTRCADLRKRRRMV
ncbi:guanine nucleotide exchange factor DBS-like isoform X1 [Vespula squamosa]|uniref:Guanine nucleotide exchange factor DBS-like isoform X1 n=1 Tax=Vespula squamosa TaxID=30214 RepID=A0ABD2BY26_VESSQ